MTDDVDAGVYRALSSLRGLHVSFDLAAALGRLADRQLDLVHRVAPGLAVNAELDRPRAEEQVLAHRADDFFRSVGIEVLGIDNTVLLVHLRRRPELATGAA